jgi:hypothetical protein
MEKSAASVAEFIESLPEDRRADVALLDRLISERMPEAERVLWEGVFWGGTQQRIIGYGNWEYKGRSGSQGEWFRVGLGMQKNYLSVYINAWEDGESLPKRYGKSVGAAKVGSSVLSFRSLDGIDLEELGRIIALAATAGSDGRI